MSGRIPIGARTRTQIACMAACVALAGCGTSPSPRYYTLQGPASPAPATQDIAIAVGPVSIPAVVDRPEIVVTLSGNEVWPDEYNRWAGPLAEGIGLVLVENLVAQLGAPRIALATQTALDTPDYRIAVDVQRFESVPGSHALVDVVYAVKRVRDGTVEGGRATYRVAVTDKGYDALAAAHGRAVAMVAADFARAVRKVGAAPPLPAVGAAAPSPAR